MSEKILCLYLRRPYMRFEDIFPTDFGYPDMPMMLEEGPLPGCWYEYVSNTFLNGYLPYLTPVAVFLLQRYRDGSGDDKDDAPITDKKVEEILESIHTNFGEFQDDVVFVGATPNFWWMLHMDCDISDCCIGRVRKDGTTEQQMVEGARAYCNADGASWSLRAEIPVGKLKGWLRFC